MLHIYDGTLESTKIKIIKTASRVYEAREDDFSIRVWLSQGTYHALLEYKNGENVIALGMSCSGVLSILHRKLQQIEATK